MSIQIDEACYLPLQMATKYYSKWDCDTTSKVHNGVYYKCLNGIGNVYYSNGNQYHGAFQNGLMHGKGTYLWKNGLKYQGQFSNNHLTGQGTLTWPNGSTYTGTVNSGKRHGWGEYHNSIDGSSYRGSWKEGQKEGQGILNFSNGSVYQGIFKSGVRQGAGKMKFLSGNWYEGSWKNDKKSGFGTMHWVSANQRYEGEWNSDMPEGSGTYYWMQANSRTIKTIYKGQWRNGKRNGWGAFYYNAGCKMEGSFKENLKEGLFYLQDQYGEGHIEFFTNDKSILKRQALQQKQDLKHLKMSQNQKDTGTIHNQQPAQNNYGRSIAIDHPSIDQTIYNLLLRQNSQLRLWYKTISSSLNKQLFGGFGIQGIWRVIKDLKLTNEFITIARLNRQFCQGSKAQFSLSFPKPNKLELIKEYNQLLNKNYNTFELDVFFHQTSSKQIDWKNWCNNKQKNKKQSKTLSLHQVTTKSPFNPHKHDQILLFRHFVEYILHIALLQHQQQQADQPNHSTFRKHLQDLLSSMRSVVNPVPSLQSDKMTSEVLTNVSNNQQRGGIGQEYLAMNNQLFSRISEQQQQMLSNVDRTVSVRQLYCLLCECGYLKQANQKLFFLQKIERSMKHRCGLIKKEYKTWFAELQKVILTSPQFHYILSYQLIFYEFSEILHLFLNKKIGNAHSKEEFQKKYQEIISNIINTLLTLRSPKNNPNFISKQSVKQSANKEKCTVSFRWGRISSKDNLRAELEQKLQDQRKRIEQQKRKLSELERQNRQRIIMSKEDSDIKDEDDIEEKQDDEFYD